MVGLLCLISAALTIYWFVLIARVVLSWATIFGWTPPDVLSPAIRIVYQLTEPPLSFLRRYIPAVGMFDWSVLVLFLIVGAARAALPC